MQNHVNFEEAYETTRIVKKPANHCKKTQEAFKTMVLTKKPATPSICQRSLQNHKDEQEAYPRIILYAVPSYYFPTLQKRYQRGYKQTSAPYLF